MTRFIKLTLLSLAVALTLASCGTHKKVVDPSQPSGPATPSSSATAAAKQQLQAVVAATGAWSTLQANGNIAIAGGTSFSSTVQVRMVRDQVLYISLRPLLGIEAGRIIIKGDSLFVINKLQKQYLAEKVSLITAGVPATVGMMQDMFLGRPFVIGEGSLNASRRSLVTAVPQGDGCTIAPVKQPRDFAYSFACNAQGQVLSLDVRLTQGDAAYSMNYADVRRTLAGNIAHALRFATAIGGKEFRLKLSYDQIAWNQDVDTGFSIPHGYTRIDGRAMLKLFAQ